MDKTDGFIPGMEDSEDAAKSFLDSFLDVQSPADEISDSDLQARDTANMIKHGELYTQLLDIYVSDIKVTLRSKRKLKEEFYDICVFLLIFTCTVFCLVVLLMILGLVPSDSVAIPVGIIVSFLTVFIVIPHTITTYLFNTEVEKYMAEIIKSVQDHDVEIRKNIKENV